MTALSIPHVLSALLVIGVRVSGLMLFAPFFGSVAIPARVKPMVVLALTALLYPVVSARIPALLPSDWPMVSLSEFTIGVASGITTNLVFDAVQMAGQLLSVQMGYSLINILDPQTQVESTVVATFHQTIAMLIFLRVGAHLWILHALAHSFDYLPPSSGHIRGALVVTLFQVAGSVFSIGVQIAAPVLSATLLADIAIGLLGKAAPQLPLMVMGPAVKTLPGLLILMAALRYWPTLFTGLFLSSIEMSDHLLHLAQ